MTGLDIARVRPVIESEIERLIGILDMLEPDPDFEEGADLEADMADDEPLLGAPNERTGSWNGLWPGLGDDRELDDCDLEDDGDHEPLLGAPNQQAGHWDGIESNYHDDAELDDADAEPWLGASEPVYNGSYSQNSIKDMIRHHMRPDLYADTPTVTTQETSQLGWSSHKFSDDRELVDEREPFGGGSSCYAGPCSDLSTLLRSPASDAATQPAL